MKLTEYFIFYSISNLYNIFTYQITRFCLWFKDLVSYILYCFRMVPVYTSRSCNAKYRVCAVCSTLKHGRSFARFGAEAGLHWSKLRASVGLATRESPQLLTSKQSCTERSSGSRARVRKVSVFYGTHLVFSLDSGPSNQWNNTLIILLIGSK